MSGRYPTPHIWDPRYSNHQPTAGAPHQSYDGLRYGGQPHVQTMGFSSGYPSQQPQSHFVPRPQRSTYQSQSLGLPRSYPTSPTKKPQQDNVSLPEGAEMRDGSRVYCKNCDREFPEISQFRDHEAHHKKCDVPGCTFVGTNRALNIHKEEKHTAVSKLVPALETPDQIAKWREARRKNFPSADNVAKKKTVAQAKRSRGQVARKEVHSYKGNFPRQGSQQRSSAGNQATKSKPSAGSSTVCLSSARIGVAPSTEQSSHCEQTPAFDGEPPAKRQCHEGADPESRPVNDSSLPTSAVANADGLASLSSYASDNSDSEAGVEILMEMIGKRSSGTPEAAHARTTAQAGNDTAAQASTSRDQRDELEDGELTVVSETAGVDDVVVVDKVEESDVFSALIADAGRLQPTAAGSEASGGGHLAAAVAASGDRRHPRRNQKQRGKKDHSLSSFSKANAKPSLLEKLLASEVRRERNILLQCIRHIVRENLFQPPADMHTAT